MSARINWDDLPLFATDAEISRALLGPERACEWRSIVPLYEKRGLPKVDPIMGGRYTPAIKAFFDIEYGIGQVAPIAPDGMDGTWKSQKQKA